MPSSLPHGEQNILLVNAMQSAESIEKEKLSKKKMPTLNIKKVKEPLGRDDTRTNRQFRQYT